MSIATRLTDLTTRIATECKSIRMLINNNQSSLSSLTTTDKSNLVGAINELAARKIIDDTAASGTTKTWSIDSIKQHIGDVIGSAPESLNSLKELADALNNDANFAANVTAALANSVTSDKIGDTDTNFVAVFNNGLV